MWVEVREGGGGEGDPSKREEGRVRGRKGHRGRAQLLDAITAQRLSDGTHKRQDRLYPPLLLLLLLLLLLFSQICHHIHGRHIPMKPFKTTPMPTAASAMRQPPPCTAKQCDPQLWPAPPHHPT